MDISYGIYTLGPESGQLLIKTSRTGLGAKAGHDLTIEVTRWQADVTLDSADAARSSVNVEVDAGSLEVREGSDGDLTITGTTQPVTVHGRLTAGRLEGSAAIVQTRWGIRPYTAFFGALKLSDEVKVEFGVRITPDG